MRFLFIMDPLEKLALRWDTSLCLLRELAGRGHENWTADSGDLWAEKKGVFGRVRKLVPLPRRDGTRLGDYKLSAPGVRNLREFDLVLVRKDPPFDTEYLTLTHLLEPLAKEMPVVNHPRGIRDTGEKLACLNFPKWIPETLVTSSAEKILEFQRRVKSDVILKPCGEKGGKGILLLKRGGVNLSKIRRAVHHGKKTMIAQRYLRDPKIPGDKRILLLNGRFLGAFERHRAKGEFRANLSLGGTFHAATLTKKEEALIGELRSYLKEAGLHFVGIDTMADKLIEINVTSPAGLVELRWLDPRSDAAASLANSLEVLARP